MNHFEILKKVILENSIGDNWGTAVMEWEIRSLREDPSSSSICVCNKKGLRYCFTIQNVKNGRQLHPIGSTCIKKFGRKDLDISVDTWEKMYHLQEDLTSSARLKPADSLDFFGITQAYSLRYSRYFRILPLMVLCDVHDSPRLWPMSGPPDIFLVRAIRTQNIVSSLH